ncbi:Hypothetical predicted protein [Marmota monax]|uniref:Transmembrane protein 106C n=1 Tax=Marmota monax TaxID=9995 RepID=A0A5E4C237_MARMO|nr:hypothetical protein GHT09_003120 [Marmota monax]VTJ75868.1 Hypothetical predicted protein [Marmota monax]
MTRVAHHGHGISAFSFAHAPSCKRKKEDDREALLTDLEQEEAIAQFPYVEFTGRDSITCLTCQGTGYIPTEQVNELVALIPHSDQRLRPQRTKQYVLLSVLLCLLASGLVVFFLFPHSVLVGDDGIKVVKVTFNKQDSLVILAITATLKIRNSNFYPVTVTRLSSQVQYMNTVVGTYVTTNISPIPPRSEQLVSCFLGVPVPQCGSKVSAVRTHSLFQSAFPLLCLKDLTRTTTEKSI